MTDRGVSTVVDAVLCLLLVSGAVATLAYVPADTDPSRPDTADETADVVGSSTARVDYTLATPNGDVERSTQGTLAELLADAAVANMTVYGHQLSDDSDAFEREVTAVVESAVARPNVSVTVRATWEPYPNSPVKGTVTAGDVPPPNADVHVATLTVPSDSSTNRNDAVRAASDGFRGVARVTARGVVGALFPPEEASVSLQDPQTKRATAERYRRAATLFDSRVDNDDPEQVRRTNERLTAALVDRTVGDFTDQFDTPQSAAEAVSVGEVRIVVRTWER
ncbi:DUF7284 family protein [Halostella pelagica]|uniref:DUF7284 family protein n=1 Tax=Halostella pelagica TaxID=2583824 RepID=UPI001080A7B6|nr:hypothetical protein [Halostella pelagica]